MYIDHDVCPEDGRQFATRYYRWALEQWRLEVDQDLETLRSITGPISANVVRAFEYLERDERLSVGFALVKHLNKVALCVLGEEFTLSDERSVKTHFQRTSAELDRWMWAMARQGDPRDPWHPSMTRHRPATAVASLRKEVRRALEPVLGQDLYRFDPCRWRYRTPVGRWTILTEVFFRVGLGDLAYSHQIRFGNEAESMCRFISVLEWLGVSSAATTDWVLSSAEDIPAVAATLATLCQRFIAAAPSLLPE
jgi:hypothetical protein